MQALRFICILTLTTLFTVSCGEGTPEEQPSADTFDRNEMLTHWVDNIILPAYDEYQSATLSLGVAVEHFAEEPSATTLAVARTEWFEAYRTWQTVSLYNIGPAEQYRISNFTNIYPTDVALIESNIAAGEANLSLPSNGVAQGYPALEYLLYGDNVSTEMLLEQYDERRLAYLKDITKIILDNAALLYDEWSGDYRADFISQSGSSATASVNKMTNDFVFHYEKTIRAAKVGIPAGVFSTEALPDRVEGYFANGVSKRLFLEALDSFMAFFNGQPHSDSVRGPGYATYLDYLDNNQDLAADILTQLNNARALAVKLDDDFQQQVLDDNTQMLALYDELQKAVVLLKVDMMQSLNIKIDYVDADGD